MNKKIGYRSEIDGLRAIAVFAVILFTTQSFILIKIFIFRWIFRVDIFFVISGYLITNILYNEFVVTKSISIKNFYERRKKEYCLHSFFIIIINSNFYICFTSNHSGYFCKISFIINFFCI